MAFTHAAMRPRDPGPRVDQAARVSTPATDYLIINLQYWYWKL
jgi:hypothetical protein